MPCATRCASTACCNSEKIGNRLLAPRLGNTLLCLRCLTERASEADPQQELTLTRITAKPRIVVQRGSIAKRLRIDIAKARNRDTPSVSPLCRERIGRDRIGHIRPIEYVKELASQ